MTTATTDGRQGGHGHPGRPVRLRRRPGRPHRRRRTPGLTFDETAARMFALGNDPITAVHLNLPSINAPVLPGRLDHDPHRDQRHRPAADLRRHARRPPAGSTITVAPTHVHAGAGRVRRADDHDRVRPRRRRQYFGADQAGAATGPACRRCTCRWRSCRSRATSPDQHVRAGTIIAARRSTSLHGHRDEQLVRRRRRRPRRRRSTASCAITGVDRRDRRPTPCSVATTSVTLAGAQPGVPSIAPGAGPAGYLPLAGFGITPDPDRRRGDPQLQRAGVRLQRRDVQRGSASTPTATSSSAAAPPRTTTAATCRRIPDPARPNNILAPFWTDLDGTGAPGHLRAAR